MIAQAQKRSKDALDACMFFFLAFFWGLALANVKLPVWLGAAVTTGALLLVGLLNQAAPRGAALYALLPWVAANCILYWFVVGILNSLGW